MRKIKDQPQIDMKDLRRVRIFVTGLTSLLILYFIIWGVMYSFMDAISILAMAFLKSLTHHSSTYPDGGSFLLV